MMELCAQELATGIRCAMGHVKRDQNTWADDLSNKKVQGFTEAVCLGKDSSVFPKWLVFQKILDLERAMVASGT